MHTHLIYLKMNEHCKEAIFQLKEIDFGKYY